MVLTVGCRWYSILIIQYRICSKKGPGALSKLIKPGSTFPLEQRPRGLCLDRGFY